MRWWLTSVVILFFCCEANGQQNKQIFELPFSQKPPPKIKRIMEDADQALHDDVQKTLADTERKLRTEFERSQDKKRLDESNFAYATIDVYKTWLLNRQFFRNTPSPVGKWQRRDTTFFMTFHADGTITPSWHKGGCLWNVDGLGKLRAIYMGSSREAYVFKFEDNGDKLVATTGQVGETWIRVK